MPLLDSFKVDHTKMKTPGIRLAKTISRDNADIISVYDLRFCKPNEEIMPPAGIHTLEHLFAGFMRNNIKGCINDIQGINSDIEIIDISPMGCRTGFYMSVVSSLEIDIQSIKKAWFMSMHDVLNVTDESKIPELNIYQCGTYNMHSLDEAKDIARVIITKASDNGGLFTIDNESIKLSDDQLSQLGCN